MIDIQVARDEVIKAAKKAILSLGNGSAMSELARAVAILEELEMADMYLHEFAPMISSAPSYNKRYFMEWMRNLSKTTITKIDKNKLPGVR